MTRGISVDHDEPAFGIAFEPVEASHEVAVEDLAVPESMSGGSTARTAPGRIDLVNDLVYMSAMRTVNIHEAKTHLSRLLALVAAGEEIIIAKAGRPLARLVPVTAPTGDRVLGLDRGRAAIADDFDAALPEGILSTFER